MSIPAQGAVGAETMTAGPKMVLLPMDDPSQPLHHSGLPSAMIRAGGDAFHRLKRDHSLVADSCSLAVGIYRAMTEAHAKEIATLTPPAALASPRADSDERTAGVLWSAWSEDDCDSDPRIDPMAQKVTEWFVGRWPVGADEPECRILIGSGRSAEIIARRIAEKLTSVLNTDAIQARKAATPAQPAGAVPDSLRALSEKIKSAVLYARRGGFTRSTLFLTDEESNCILAALISTHPAGQSAETDALVDRFAVALKAKLRAAEAKYGWQNGWLKSDWQVECRNGLLLHVGKGDPLDVAAYAAFCWHHGWSTSSQRSTEFVTGAVEPTAAAIAAYTARYPDGALSETCDHAIECWNRVAVAACLAGQGTGQGADPVETVARALYEHNNRGLRDVWAWDADGLEEEHPGTRERYERQAAAALKAIGAEETEDDLDRRIARTGARENMQLIDGIADLIGLPHDVELQVSHVREALAKPAPDSPLTGPVGVEGAIARAAYVRICRHDQKEGWREAGADFDRQEEDGGCYVDALELARAIGSDAASALAARPAAPEAQGAWLPISTAPRNDTLVMLGWWCDVGGDPRWIAVAGWYEAGPADQCWYAAYDEERIEPTHWQPLDRLPAPPSSGQGGR